MRKLFARALVFSVAVAAFAPAWATQFLKQSTASQAVVMGPFVDSTDGDTEESGLTIANTDVRISKNGANIAAKNSGGCTYDESGMYTCTFDATDTDTVGRMQVTIHVSGALAVTEDFVVLPANVYDSLIGGTDTLNAAVTEWNGVTLATTNPLPNAAADAAGGLPISDAGGLDLDGLDTNVSSILTDTGTTIPGAITTAQNDLDTITGTSGVLIDDGAISEASYDTTAGSFWPLQVVDQGTAQSATSTTLVLRAADTFADDELIGATACITGGSAGVGQCQIVTDYTNSNDTATVAGWTTTPSGTITYKVFGTAPGTGGSVAISAGGITASSFAASAITSTVLADNAITAAKIATDAIGADEVADGAIDEGAFSATGPFGPLGIIDQGTAQSVGASTLVLRSAASFANDEIIGATCVITSASTGTGQARTVSDYVGSSDTATMDSAWTTTPTGTITYACFGTAAASTSGLTQADVRTAIGMSSANLDTQLSAIDSDTGAILVDTGTTLPALFGTPAGADLAADIAAVKSDSGAILTDTGTTLPALFGTPVGADFSADIAAVKSDTGSILTDTAEIGTAGAGLTEAGGTGDQFTAIGGLGSTAQANVRTAVGMISGTCDSGSTTTCVDDALTQADASQLDDHMICFDDNWCSLIDSFVPATDTVTTTKTAPSTRASKVYTIIPATAQ